MDNFWGTSPNMEIMTYTYLTAPSLPLQPFRLTGKLNLRDWQRSTGILTVTHLNDVPAGKVVITQNSRFHLTQICCSQLDRQEQHACMTLGHVCFVNMWYIQPRPAVILSNLNCCAAVLPWVTFLWPSSISINYASFFIYLFFLSWCWLVIIPSTTSLYPRFLLNIYWRIPQKLDTGLWTNTWLHQYNYIEWTTEVRKCN